MQLQLELDNLKEAKVSMQQKKDRKSFYAYVRSKNIRDKVGPLEDSAGNIISQVFFNGGRRKCILQFSVCQRGY